VAALPHPRSRRCAPSASSAPCPSSTRRGSARGTTGGASSSPCPSGCRTRASQASSARRGGSRRATTRSARWTGSSGSAHARVRRPPKASGLPRVVEATAEELAVERFHGRDKAWTSRGGTAAQRFRYASSDGELEELTGPVAELAGQARETYVLMNNCHRDDAGATPPRCGTCSPGSPADDDRARRRRRSGPPTRPSASAGARAHPAVIEPNSPSSSSLGPAVKNSAVVSLVAGRNLLLGVGRHRPPDVRLPRRAVRSPTLPSLESLGLVPMVKHQRVAIRIANDRLVAEARVEHRATSEVRA
jgi:hypothetical protein